MIYNYNLLSSTVLITAVLGVRSHFRFTRILNATRERKIVHRLEYFRDMNVMLTIILFIYGTCLVILCVDGLTAEKPINSHKFGTDLLIVNCNICIIFLWIAFVRAMIGDCSDAILRLTTCHILDIHLPPSSYIY